jgi:hypothetical protein
MPRNNEDFYLERMGKALGFHGYVPQDRGVLTHVMPGPAAKAANPVPFTNNVRVIEKGTTNPPTVGIRKSPPTPTRGGGGPMGNSGGSPTGGRGGGGLFGGKLGGSGGGLFGQIK